MPQPVLSTWRTSALPSPLVSLRNSDVRRRRHDDAAVGERQAGRDVEVLGEHRELVGAAVAVGVLEDLDAVVAGLAVQHVVRIVDRLDHPQPAALVEGERDRLDDVRLAREQLELELGRHLDELHRLVGGERQLILRRRIALLVVRHVEAVDVGDRPASSARQAGAPARPRSRRRPARPASGTRVAPRALVVAVGGVEDAALALRAHPRPRLASLSVDALHQHRAVGARRLRRRGSRPTSRTAARLARSDARPARSRR